MNQVEEFEKVVEEAKSKPVKVVVVTGKPGSGKSKVLREAAEDKKWDYIDCRLLITEQFLEIPPAERRDKAAAMMSEILDTYDAEVIMLDRLQTLFVPRRGLYPLECRLITVLYPVRGLSWHRQKDDWQCLRAAVTARD